MENTTSLDSQLKNVSCGGDALFIEQCQYTRAEVARIFNIPPSLIGPKSESNYHKMKDAMLQFYLGLEKMVEKFNKG
jgi:phage portal protein BeeE